MNPPDLNTRRIVRTIGPAGAESTKESEARSQYDSWRRDVVSRLVERHGDPSDLGGRWRGRPYAHVLREDRRQANLLPGVRPEDLSGIDLHPGFGHLNSSQAMCINFFAPLRRRPGALRGLLGRIAGEDAGEVSFSEFEHAPDGPKRTHHDFFAETKSGLRFFFEVKFTENGFGGIHARSRSSWPFWRLKLGSSLNLRDLSADEFFSEYQIYRVVADIQTDKDHAVFLYPSDNPSLRLPDRVLHSPGVHIVDWNDAVAWTGSRDFARKYALLGASNPPCP